MSLSVPHGCRNGRDNMTTTYRISGRNARGFPIVSAYRNGVLHHEERTLYGMGDVERFSELAGQHWFSTDTKRFFGSRIGGTLYGGRYFVSSEYTGFNHDGRAYTVRYVENDGGIGTVGDFLEYETYGKAHRVAAKLGREILAAEVTI